MCTVGAFVGAAPHLTYKQLLETLGDAGYVIVATPYRLDMDYTAICDKILAKFDGVGVDLAKEYGPLPVIGLGHSCGALLQTLITSLFPDTPRALNILISYNNKPPDKAIPAFQEAVIPLAEALARDSPESRQVRQFASDVRSTIDLAVDIFSDSTIAPAFVGSELVPLLRQGLEITDQIFPLLTSIGSGQTEFVPTPVNAKEVCRRMYRARKTLLLKFENDALDESVDIERVLREANTIMRMKRPMVEMEVELRVLAGTHLTPLTQNVFPDPVDLLTAARDTGSTGENDLDALIGVVGNLDVTKSVRTELKGQFLRTLDTLTSEILTFLGSSIVAPRK